VSSKNLHRRHLTTSQRAMVAGRIANLGRGGDQKSDQSADLRIGPTTAETSKTLNVGTRSIENA
jgi:hypothetical protein